MYAVIKTGGKQYRVQAGDLLVVEKLDGKPGAKLAFDEVLMIGEGASVRLGEPTIKGASVSATLVETRKGEKIKVFKKIRRQGYRRTRGHRQFQSVLRVTGIAGDGKEETWDGKVDLTPLAVLNARARNLARGMEAAEAKRSAGDAPKAAKAKPAATEKTAKTKSKPAPPATPAPPKSEARPAKTAAAKAPDTSGSAKKAAKKPAAEKSAAKKPDSKKPAPKKAATKTSGSKKPAAKSAGKPARKG
jgi:large subunit ribosomal protein L21